MFRRYEQSLLREQFGEESLPSPIEGILEIKNIEKELREDEITDISILTEQIPPAPVRNAAAKSALEGGYIKNYYPLRKKISEFYENQREASYDPEKEIILTCGGQQALDGAFKLLIEPGDEVVMVEPEYAPNEPMVNFFDGEATTVPLNYDDGQWSFDIEPFKEAVTDDTKAILLSSPNNPSGYVYREEEIDAIADLVTDTDTWLISDEIWASLITDPESEFTSFASRDRIRDRLITIFSMSKTYGMSGYRIGAMLGPPEVIRSMSQVVRFSTMSVPTMSSVAACEALDPEKTGDWLETRITRIRGRINETVDRFEEYDGITCAKPESGVFLFPDIGDYGMSSQTFSKRLLREKRVKVIPGYIYGKNMDDFLRISMSVPDEDYRSGIDEFVEFIEELE